MHRMLITTGIAASMAIAAAVPANAAIVPLQFDHAALYTPATPDMQPVSPSTPPLKINADVNQTTGDYTVQPADWDFPEYAFSSPIPGRVDITLPTPATGRVDFATGKLSLSGTFDLQIFAEGVGTCTKTVPLTLTTETTKPVAGVPFPAGADGFATGNGAFGTGWDTLPAGTGDGCPTIDEATKGEGGFWISRGIAPQGSTPPPPAGAPALALKLKKPKAVKSGKSASVKATVSNTGTAAGAGVKVCLKAPKPLKLKSKCKTVGALDTGASQTVSFSVKTKKGKKGTYSLKGTASGTDGTSATAKTKLKVSK
jgi:hypothetical protein